MPISIYLIGADKFLFILIGCLIDTITFLSACLVLSADAPEALIP